MSPAKSRRALLVLGMHRSGTSALARVLSLRGASLPATLMAPNRGNPSGFAQLTGPLMERAMRRATTIGSGSGVVTRSAQRRSRRPMPSMRLSEAR